MSKNRAKKARRDGHGLERKVAKDLSELFPDELIGTTRLHSKIQDYNKIDIFFDNLRYAIQCKKKLSTAKEAHTVDISSLLEMKTNKIPLLITKINVPQGTREKHLKTFVTLSYEDFVNILKEQQIDNRWKHTKE